MEKSLNEWALCGAGARTGCERKASVIGKQATRDNSNCDDKPGAL